MLQVNRQILKEEEEKAKIQRDLSILTDRLSKINESLARKVQARNEYDRTVQETEVSARRVVHCCVRLFLRRLWLLSAVVVSVVIQMAHSFARVIFD